MKSPAKENVTIEEIMCARSKSKLWWQAENEAINVPNNECALHYRETQILIVLSWKPQHLLSKCYQ